ncbi:hypothetical protein L1987_32927 [Smallanthus sonchifolius]|uniref:Uncharacterized protein n=1 Tax=Smallanthus sonchifolius TaxID=185202 RepID=A0ACB9HQZ6_9ASTR|nr:hypothetical protein L1987_32927 [Smallanthus sonchifolius]
MGSPIGYRLPIIHKPADELRDEAYARSWSYKECTKALHNRRLKGVKDFKCGDRVLVYNSRLKLFPGKLKSRWTRPYTVKEAFPYGTVELHDEKGSTWKSTPRGTRGIWGASLAVRERQIELPVFLSPAACLIATSHLAQRSVGRAHFHTEGRVRGAVPDSSGATCLPIRGSRGASSSDAEPIPLREVRRHGALPASWDGLGADGGVRTALEATGVY